jgi:outer membrane protein OmpA-like peptidoglycan-associated protein
MTRLPQAALAVFALALLSACSSTPTPSPTLDAARNDFRAVQSDARTRALAPGELVQADAALRRATDASIEREDRASVDHLAYLARQRVAIVVATANRKIAEEDMVTATRERDRMRLAARTTEADTATVAAQSAQRDAEASQRMSADTQQRNTRLEAQLAALNAKKTDRGMVVTLGDVLFDTDRSVLRAGSQRNLEKLAVFLNAYPTRRAMVEGYTDSVGSEEHNQQLSDRRADAVRMAIVGLGVAGERITAQGHGESFPVAGNDSASGRQMNRRVEIVLSDEAGAITPR